MDGRRRRRAAGLVLDVLIRISTCGLPLPVRVRRAESSDGNECNDQSCCGKGELRQPVRGLHSHVEVGEAGDKK